MAVVPSAPTTLESSPAAIARTLLPTRTAKPVPTPVGLGSSRISGRIVIVRVPAVLAVMPDVAVSVPMPAPAVPSTPRMSREP